MGGGWGEGEQIRRAGARAGEARRATQGSDHPPYPGRATRDYSRATKDRGRALIAWAKRAGKCPRNTTTYLMQCQCYCLVPPTPNC